MTTTMNIKVPDRHEEECEETIQLIAAKLNKAGKPINKMLEKSSAN